MINPVLKVDNLCKKINQKIILDNVSFEIYPGDILGFLGSNGAGKTTTIKLITDLIKPSKGDIVINGFSLNKNRKEALSNIGAMIETPTFYNHLTGYQNLWQSIRLHPNINKNSITDLIKSMNMEDYIKRKVKTYSLGMKQRLGLAQAMVNNPSLLVLDEPLNGLDPSGIEEFRTYIQKLARENQVSILLSSHILSEVELTCNKIVILEKGKIVYKENLKEDRNQHIQYKLRVDNVDQVKKILGNKFIKYTFSQDSFYIHIKDNEDISIIVKLLVENGVKIYEVTPSNTSLANKFLSVIGEGIKKTND